MGVTDTSCVLSFVKIFVVVVTPVVFVLFIKTKKRNENKKEKKEKRGRGEYHSERDFEEHEGDFVCEATY